MDIIQIAHHNAAAVMSYEARKPKARYAPPRRLVLTKKGKPTAFVATVPLTEDGLYRLARMGAADEFEMHIEQASIKVFRVSQAQRENLRSEDRETRRATAREVSNWLIRNCKQ